MAKIGGRLESEGRLCTLQIARDFTCLNSRWSRRQAHHHQQQHPLRHHTANTAAANRRRRCRLPEHAAAETYCEHTMPDKKQRRGAQGRGRAPLKVTQPKSAKKQKKPLPGTVKHSLKKKGGFHERFLRLGSNEKNDAALARANQRTKAVGGKGKVGGQYKHYYQEDKMAAVRARLKEPRDGADRPGFRYLQDTYHVPRQTINDTVQMALYEIQEDGTKVERDTPLAWDDPSLYVGKPGRQPSVPENVMEIFVGLLSKADDAGIARQFSEDEADELVMGLMEAYQVDCPQTWHISGGPTKSWWKWFYANPAAAHLSKGIESRLDEIRMTAQTEPAVREWFDRFLKPLEAGEEPSCGRTEGYAFLSVTGITAYLKKEMPDFVPKKEGGDEIDEEALENLAWEICHDPRRQSNFDQKGHSLGGKGKVYVIGTKGRVKVKRDAADGRWLTIAPLLFGDGKLGFCGIVVQGKFPVDRDEATEKAAAAVEAATQKDKAAAAAAVSSGDLQSATEDLEALEQPDPAPPGTMHESNVPVGVPTLRSQLGDFVTSFGSTKSGYSNHDEHLKMWMEGIKELKRREPWRFPFVCWLDNWSGHLSPEFRKFCRANGVIINAFRAHTTTWSCPLDNNAFGRYQKKYNAAIGQENANKGMRIGKLPFGCIMRAVRRAMEHSFLSDEAQELNRRSFTKTIWSEMSDEAAHVTAGSEQPALTPIVLDADSVVRRLQRRTDKHLRGEALDEEDRDRADLKRVRHSETNVQHEQARAAAAANPEVVKLIARTSGVKAGAQVETIDAPGTADHGKMACFVCRAKLEINKGKSAKNSFCGGSMTFAEMEAADKEKVLEQAKEVLEKQSRADRAAASKAAKEAEKAAFETALEAQAKEMDAALALRGRPNRERRIARLRAVLEAGEAAAKGVPGAFTQQKERLAAAKTALATLVKEKDEEEKAAAKKEAAEAKKKKDAARLRKLKQAEDRRLKAQSGWQKRLAGLLRKPPAEQKKGLEQLQKAMELHVKSAWEQSQLEGGA